MARRIAMLIAVVAALVHGPASATAQEGTISGTVRDAVGGTVPGATVTAMKDGSSTKTSRVSSGDGSYLLRVPPGTYTVEVAMSGFRTQSKTGVAVTGTAQATADFTLELKAAGEITVTATKRETELNDVPFSVAAPTERQLRARGVEDLQGVAANVVGFTVQNLGPGQSQVAIRGVSAGQIVRDQPGVKEQVGVYLDESTISLSLFTPDIDLFDMNRIEVLRGPQGTLFGSGSLSGTVRYISNKPELGVQKVFGEVGLGSTTGGDASGGVKMGVNLPLADNAALRITGYHSRMGGYMDAVQPDLSVDENVNSGTRTGVRIALFTQPSEKLTISPRIFYQEVNMDGWNRNDVYNILANPYTTTRPNVNLGDRQLFTQFEEPFGDEFLLADVDVSYDFGNVQLTSITSYTNRDVDVVRDATALTASITGGSIGLGENIYSIDAPLDDATTAKVWTQEVRLAGSEDKLTWVAGGFYSLMDRDYGQSLAVHGFEDAAGIPTAGSFGAGKDILYFSDLGYELRQFAVFGEATYEVNDKLSLTGGLRWYNFEEDRVQTFDGIFADPGTSRGSTDANGVAPRVIATYKLGETSVSAQVAKGFRLGGINDPLNAPLCTPQDLVTFGGQESWDDETAWNYEVGTKSKILGGKGTLNLSGFYVDIRDLQATVTAGSCSSRVIFNVPKARSRGIEMELAVAPNDNFDFAVSASFTDAELRSTLTSTAADGTVSVVAGIEQGKRLPSVPEFQMSSALTYQWLVGRSVPYVTAVYQHVGSRFTQIGDQADGFGTVNLDSFAPNTIGGPLTQHTFVFNPELPAYDLVNLRFGVLHGAWDFAAYVNNVTNERALLALDQERGTRARVGYLVNQPRSFGVTAKFTF